MKSTLLPLRLLGASCALALSFVAAPASAQADNDTQLWLEAGIRGDITDDLDLTFTQAFRFDQRISRLGRVLPELAFGYDLPHGFDLDLGYRFTADKRDEGDWRYEHRIYFGGSYSGDVGPLNLQYRLRFQEDLYEKRGEKLNDHMLRNRFRTRLEVNDVVQPFIAMELFTLLAGESAIDLTSWRFTLGLDFDLENGHDITTYYHLRRKTDGTGSMDHILGLSYRFNL